MANTSVPHARPTQNPFPAWHLRDGTMNAAEDAIESASSSCERWEWGCASVVVLSVVAELVLASIHPSYDSPWNRWGSAIADALIALGIVGEVLFGRMDGRYQTELRKRSNARLADAIATGAAAERQAAEAYNELIFTRLRRTIDTESLPQVMALLTPFAGVHFDVSVGRYSGEQWAFLWEFGPALQASGWIWDDFATPGGPLAQHLFQQPGRPWCSATAGTNVEIHVHPATTAPLVRPAASALTGTLRHIGIDADWLPFNLHNAVPDRVHIVIGDRL